MNNQILEILEKINPGADYAGCTTLVDDRVLDSLSLLALAAELEGVFDVRIPAVEIAAGNFNSVDAISVMIQRLRGEGED